MKCTSYQIVKNLPVKKEWGLTQGRILRVYTNCIGTPTNSDTVYLVEGLNFIDVTKVLSDFDFSRKEYFNEFNTESKFHKGDIVCTKKYGICAILYEITSKPTGVGKVVKIGEPTYMVKPQNNHKDEYKVKESDLMPYTEYWFITSSGDIQRDYEERETIKNFRSINNNILKFRKGTGNYYKTHKEVTAAHDEIFRQIYSNE
jgi:hypothetical protein